MHPTRFLAVALILAGLLAAGRTAKAEDRPSFEDAEVVARSPIIVVARLKEGSVQYVPHETRPHGGRSWEHRAILVVTRVLKGELKPGEIPITIGYGLDPVIDGVWEHEGDLIDLRWDDRERPEGIIEIVDTLNSVHDFTPLVPDARDEHLWFLRPRKAIEPMGDPEGTEAAIHDPEDLQPLALLP